MYKLLLRSIRDFRASYSKLLVFESFYFMLTGMMVIPLITFIFNRILTVVGSGTLLNTEVYRIGMSYEAIAGLVLIGLVASYALFIELSVLVLLVQQRYFGKNLAVSDALITALRKTPRLMGFGLVQLLAVLLLLIPFIDSPLSESFYELFNYTILLQNRVFDASVLLTILYIVIVLLIIYAVLRWIFVLHFIMLEGKQVSIAMKMSQALTRGRRGKLFFSLFLFNAAVFGIGFMIISLISYLPVWLDLDVLKAFSNHYSLPLSTVLGYMLAMLIIPVNIIFLTRLFYFLGYGEGRRPTDRAFVYYTWVGKKELKLTGIVGGWSKKKAFYITLASLYLVLALIVGLKANDGLVYAKWTVNIAAHRGDAENAPENTLPAVKNALAKGVQSVEIDVQLTSDEVVVLHHDQTLKRLAGSQQLVSGLTYEELQQIPLGYDHEGEPVYASTLSEVLAEVKESSNRAMLLIDLKPYGQSESLVNEVVKLIEWYEMEDLVHIQAFDQSALLQIRQLNPQIKIGQVMFFALGNLLQLDVDFYTIEQTMLTESFVNRAHRNGREVWVWTVNSKNSMKEVLSYKVDGIITDYPALAQSMIELDL